MKFHPVFQHYLGCSNTTDVFQYFKDTLTNSITLWNYFVNWDKVVNNYRNIEINLNLLNYLVGKTEQSRVYRIT
ncbi:DpnII family type II restriction endonuclease [Coleofasciculus sp. LEGE 07081]|uniref:DpnII family type II restriction endonuclease n=1 Tax=unclassified Coleofasciculus TaxID=2692782 RepID=UPI00187E3C82|nr:hypothetical protein [Coleofasciculus sp. LEGE 07081]MBE9150833.1 hypothetical protein [Coleofasciculus sp. LEGE 07092]